MNAFIKMPQYERIDFPIGIDFDRANKSEECMIFHYLYFKDIGYKCEPYFLVNVMIYK